VADDGDTQGLNGRRILVVDDDPIVVRLLRRALEQAGAQVDERDRGGQVLPAVASESYDALLLDIGLPEIGGLEVLERVRRSTDLPILMVTAEDDEPTAVRALRAGADDFVRKPLSGSEVVARTIAAIRRAPRSGEPLRVYADDFLEIDHERTEVRVRGQTVRLRPLEYRLLVTLVEHRGQTLDPRQLLRHVWEAGEADTARVKVLVSNLRSTLGKGTPIETVRGVGYRYRRPQ
jgi:two-component system KDP operon response regulator KdpE